MSVAALGLVSETRGLSLRFPRFIRVRDDKGSKIEEASSPEFLANLWRNQQGKGGIEAKGNDDGDLLDMSINQSDEDDDEYD